MTDHHAHGPWCLGDFLRRYQGPVIERWMARVLGDPAIPEANRLSERALQDHIPTILDRLVTSCDEPRDPASSQEPASQRVGAAAERHGALRFGEGYTIAAALRELSHLRAAIHDICREAGISLPGEDLLQLNAALDEAMAAAADTIDRAQQAALRASEERYRLLVDSAVDYAVFMLDADGRIVSAGASTERIFRAANDELVGQPLRAFLPPAARDTGILEQALRTAASESRFADRLLLRRRDGAPLWAELTLTVLTDGRGRAHGFSVILHDATEQVQAEQRLSESAARLSAIIASAMDAIITIDDAQRIIVFNQSAEKIFGISAADALGQPIARFIPARFHRMHARHIQQFGETGITSRTMGRLEPLVAMRASGQEFPIEATISQTQVAGHKVYTVVLRDVTEQVRASAERAALLDRERAARKAAEESEFKFRRLADSGVIGILIATRSGAILDANDAFLEMVGYSAEDLAAGRLRWLDMTPPEQLGLAEKALLDLQQLGFTKTFEKEYVRKDGSRVAIAIGAATLDPEAGTLIAFVLDITARKRAEAALQKVARERDETLALLDTFMATAPVGFAVVDQDLRYLRINETLAAMNGCPISQHLGRRPREVVPVLAEVESLLRRVLDTGEPVLGLEVQTPGATPGEMRHILANFHPIRDPTGRIYAIGSIVLDITEQARQLEEIRRNVEFRERLMAILGHDLRQPLHAIALATHIWQGHAGLPEVLARSAQMVAQAASRMKRMITDLLDFARVRQGMGLPIVPQPTELGAICRAVIDEVAMARPGCRVELVQRDGCAGEWDPDRIAQVVSNLLTNAIDYSPVGTPVRVEICGFSDRVRLQVHNQGPSIPQDLVPHLFDAFRRGRSEHPRVASQGLGLGLYIAREVVRAHDGTIAATSDPRHGTVFTVDLPKIGVTKKEHLDGSRNKDATPKSTSPGGPLDGESASSVF